MNPDRISKFVFVTSGLSETGNKSSCLSVVSSSSSTASRDNGLLDTTSDAIKPIQTDIDKPHPFDIFWCGRYVKGIVTVQPGLNEINAGDHDDLTYEEIAEQFPQEFALRDADKLRYR